MCESNLVYNPQKQGGVVDDGGALGLGNTGLKGADFLTAVVRFAQGELIGQLAGLGQGLTFGGDCVQHGENSVLELLFAGGGDAFIFADVRGGPLFIG